MNYDAERSDKSWRAASVLSAMDEERRGASQRIRIAAAASQAKALEDFANIVDRYQVAILVGIALSTRIAALPSVPAAAAVLEIAEYIATERAAAIRAELNRMEEDAKRDAQTLKELGFDTNINETRTLDADSRYDHSDYGWIDS